MKTIDLHCDTLSYLLRRRYEGNTKETLLKNKGHVDLEKLEKGGALLQNFAVFVALNQSKDPVREAMEMIDLYYEELQNNEERIAPVFCYKDIEKNEKAGKLSAMLTIEEGGVCKGNLSYLRNYYRLGVRMLTLTWNYPNEIGYPNLGDGLNRSEADGGSDAVPFHRIANVTNGLTEFGVQFVEEMERLGMIVDVSHLSDAGFYDVCRVAKKPFVASHSNARAISPWVRNLTDDMIKMLAEKGSITGLNFCPDFLTEMSEGEHNPGTIQAIVAHAKHIVNVGGIECLGLGSDFDGIPGHAGIGDYSGMPKLSDALCKAGFSPAQVEQIFYKNALRLYKEVL